MISDLGYWDWNALYWTTACWKIRFFIASQIAPPLNYQSLLKFHQKAVEVTFLRLSSTKKPKLYHKDVTIAKTLWWNTHFTSKFLKWQFTQRAGSSTFNPGVELGLKNPFWCASPKYRIMDLFKKKKWEEHWRWGLFWDRDNFWLSRESRRGDKAFHFLLPALSKCSLLLSVIIMMFWDLQRHERSAPTEAARHCCLCSHMACVSTQPHFCFFPLHFFGIYPEEFLICWQAHFPELCTKGGVHLV